MNQTQKMKLSEFLFRGIDPCLDGNCVTKKPTGGMVTNGGCRCMTNLSRGQLNILASRLQSLRDMEVEVPFYPQLKR